MTKHEALEAQGYSGHINTMTLEWLQDNGAMSSQIADAWHEMLLSHGYAGQRNEAWYELLGDQGYTGDYNEREAQFWAGGGFIQP